MPVDPGEYGCRTPHGADFAEIHSQFKQLSEEEIQSTFFTAEEVAKHNTDNDCWVTYKGRVYNLQPFLEYHPGGSSPMQAFYGYDITDMCNAVHGWVNIEKLLGPLVLGTLQGPPRLKGAANRTESGSLRRRW